MDYIVGAGILSIFLVLVAIVAVNEMVKNVKTKSKYNEHIKEKTD